MPRPAGEAESEPEPPWHRILRDIGAAVLFVGIFWLLIWPMLKGIFFSPEEEGEAGIGFPPGRAFCYSAVLVFGPTSHYRGVSYINTRCPQ